MQCTVCIVEVECVGSTFREGCSWSSSLLYPWGLNAQYSISVGVDDLCCFTTFLCL